MRTLFNEDFKPICFGDVTPDDEKMEFIYDSSENPNKATCIGIARSLCIEGNFAMNLPRLIEAIDAKLESIHKLEKTMNTANQEILDIVKEGSKSEKTEDEIIIEIVQSGISYRDALGSYERASIELGLMVKPMKPGDRNTEVTKILKSKKFKAPKDYSGVIDAVNLVLKKMDGKGVTASSVLTSIRAYAKENEIELPKQPKGKKERISAATKMTNWILDNLEEKPKAFGKFCEANKIGPARVKLFTDVMTTIQKRAEDDSEPEDSEELVDGSDD